MKDEEIIKIIRISKENISNSSLNLYLGQIKSLYRKYNDIGPLKRGESKNYEIENLDFLLDFDKMNKIMRINDRGEPLAIRSIGGFATSCLSILYSGGDYELIKKYGNIVQECNTQKEYNEDNDIVSQSKKDKYDAVSYTDVGSLIKQLKKDDLFKESLMISLMYHFHFRNEISILKKISLKTYNKLPKDKKDNNFVVVGSRVLFISRGIYKTAKEYGIVRTDIKDRQLKKDLLSYIADINEGEYIFCSISEVPYTNSHISTLIYRITEKYLGVGLGTSSINNLFMSSLDQETIEKLKEASKNRGTSINTLIKTYHNKV